jgi:hypothetical protein
MTVRPLPTDFLRNLLFAEVLVNPHASTPFGVRFGGDRPGPSALFTGPSKTIDAVSRRLIKLPTLPSAHFTVDLEKSISGLIGSEIF